jgi:hypothetical protein
MNGRTAQSSERPERPILSFRLSPVAHRAMQIEPSACANSSIAGDYRSRESEYVKCAIEMCRAIW